jgi:hypothetical protein
VIGDNSEDVSAIAGKTNLKPVGDIAKVIRRLALCIAASTFLLICSLAFADHDGGAILCLGIGSVSFVLMFIFGLLMRGRGRLAALLISVAYLFVPLLLLSNYSLVRDHVRWILLSHDYKTKIIAQSSNQVLRHIEWDGWGFAGIADTTVYLVFDPTDSLARVAGAPDPVTAAGLPCAVYRVRRLDRQWYAVNFYSDTQWGLDACK